MAKLTVNKKFRDFINSNKLKKLGINKLEIDETQEDVLLRMLKESEYFSYKIFLLNYPKKSTSI